MPEQLQAIVNNLGALGARRLGLLAAAGVLMVALIVGASVYLNRPAYEPLYVGLERADVNQIGLVLGEAGIGFDVASDGTTVLVPVGQTAEARMLLAEKGLPTSTNAGYELFDNVGSLGLTSFMQEITRIRALEGEIARTIQSIAGIRAARVHIVLAERASFRRDQQKSSASVVIRTSSSMEATRSANSIRHLVAAAVPGLEADDVTVLDSAGTLLASGDDLSNSTANRAITVEQNVALQIEDNIRRALTPYLGADNFRASVKADVNTDQRQIEETIFDPESRVERSTQIIRSNDNSQQSTTNQPATVEQNLPEEQANATEGPQSSENSERKEEVTNYEINSKKIATVSNGYDIAKLSIGVVVNQKRLAEVVGEGATPEQIAERVAEIQAMVSSAAGLSEARGDQINVAAVQFLDGLVGEPLPEPGLIDLVKSQSGTLINAGAFVIVALLVALFGLRPMMAAVTRTTPPATEMAEANLALPAAGETPQIAAGETAALPGASTGQPTALDDLRQRIRPAPQERLARLVDINEERTAQILRKWAAAEAA